MIFLYSRKMQFALLLCWLVGMAVMYVQITGERPHWLRATSERIVAQTQKAQLGQVPALPEPPPPPPPVATAPQRPPADPVLNRCLALRLDQQAGTDADTLVLEFDYLAAQTKGFTLDKARGYYLEDAPTFVVALGEPWVSDIGNASFTGSVAQLARLELIVSKSRNLRLLVHTRGMATAKGAKFHLTPTATGLRAEIRLPRQ